MAEETEMTHSPEEAPANPMEAPPYEADSFLRSMVDLINKTEMSFDVTLHVDGFLVSGRLASGKEYFAGIAKDMADAFERSAGLESSRIIHSYFSSFGRVYESPEAEEERPLPIFIHLKEARFFHNSGPAIPRNKGVWWRGRIAEISGFTMGSLRPGE